MDALLDRAVPEIELETENGFSELSELPTMPEIKQIRAATEALASLTDIDKQVLAQQFPDIPLSIGEQSSSIAIHPSAEKNILDASLRTLMYRSKE